MSSPTTVLIAGAGLGGLMMAILLDRAGIDYIVFEKSEHLRALGSATNLGCNILPLFAQLGLQDELHKISKPSSTVNVYNETMERIGHINYEEYISTCGYVSRTMARPDLHALLLAQVPASKIQFGKKIQGICQDASKVTILCSDGSSIQGDLLIGSDGAYSKVRQSLFHQLDKQHLLPKADAESLRACHMSVLGITRPVDPERYPVVREPGTRYESVIGTNKPNTWRYFTIPGNRICWRIDHHLAAYPPSSTSSSATKSSNVDNIANDNNNGNGVSPQPSALSTTNALSLDVSSNPHAKISSCTTISPSASSTTIASTSTDTTTTTTAAAAAVNLSEWGTESSDAIPDDWRKFPCPIGGTMGDLFDQTPREVVSKVVLEEKLYQTWYHGRVVLIGDACHKMLPNSGRGAVNAMLDAVVLTNVLYEKVVLSASLENVQEAFEEYYEERYPHAVAEIERSKRMARVVAGQTWLDTLVRKVFFTLLPKRFQDNSYAAMLTYRPQLSFLPFVPERGSVPALPQRKSSRPGKGLFDARAL
ncbi:hypothetical protein EC957_002432 [Mortierella hygrophila]|uniref:FAD-binding domain-containing protein n=1 Tax=Mortierella hygrophila TaxID=979708 RepID=A0A9P6FFV7_9FUNG|nr:hypothetical protein EC957_002432 [Mortierella hygrophila]